MKVNKNFKLILTAIIFFFFSINFSQSATNNFTPEDSIEPYCSGKIKFDNNLKLEKLEIFVNKNKKWTKNLLNLNVYFEDEKSKSNHQNWVPEFRIDKNFKKKFKSKVTIKYENYEPCTFDSLIRITGDMMWHLGWNNGVPISSLSVELINGHVKNITRFKLLLPASRNDKNEIFTTNFLRNLGFLAPKTFFIQAKINGSTNQYIFQEDIRKEFLESSHLKEGPILEGDERFTISLRDSENHYENKTNLSKLVNKNYSLKNNTNAKIALQAVSTLNMLFLLNHNSEYPKKMRKNIMLYMFSDVFFENKENIKILNTFEALIYALDAGHGLSPDDRRFYFNSIDRTFLPIYYDGKSYILEDKQRLSDENLAFVATKEAKDGSQEAIDKILKIDQKKLIEELDNAGIKVNNKSLKKIITKIIQRLEIINKSEPSQINPAKNGKYFSLFSKKETEEKKLVFTNYNSKKFYVCNFQIDSCKTFVPKPTEYSKYLADVLNQNFDLFYKDFKIQNDLIFVHSDMNFERLKPVFYKKLKYWNETMIGNTILEHNSDVELNIDYLKKTILITQKNKNGIVLLKNGKLKDWQIIFNGSEQLTNEEKNISLQNQSNLTGCLNIYNVSLDNISFLVSNTFCEDAVNIVNSKGAINSIVVNNSASDSVDSDFSTLDIKKVNIHNSQNDCLDLSYGTYNIENVNVKKCGDKGVSVGERSTLKINNLKVEDSSVGLASKDSSFVALNSSVIKNSLLCYAAYRKKQEFSGAKIVIDNNECNQDNVFTTPDSEIIFLK